MSDGRSPLDKLVGGQPEDVRRKFYPGEYDGTTDKALEQAQEGGSSKMPDPPTPFKLGGK